MEEPCNRKEDKERIKFKGFGIETELTGHQAVKSIFSVVAVCLLSYGLYLHDKNTVSALQEITRAQEAMIYVVKLDQPGRDALHLDKPQLIREMERKNDRN